MATGCAASGSIRKKKDRASSSTKSRCGRPTPTSGRCRRKSDTRENGLAATRLQLFEFFGRPAARLTADDHYLPVEISVNRCDPSHRPLKSNVVDAVPTIVPDIAPLRIFVSLAPYSNNRGP